jgi:hypothetical protein
MRWFGLFAVLGACAVAEPTDAVRETCEPSDDYAACTTDAGKAGYCAPDAGCVEACTAVSAVCWNYTYAWPHDPDMERDPICWCTDDNTLAPSQR